MQITLDNSMRLSQFILLSKNCQNLFLFFQHYFVSDLDAFWRKNEARNVSLMTFSSIQSGPHIRSVNNKSQTRTHVISHSFPQIFDKISKKKL